MSLGEAARPRDFLCAELEDLDLEVRLEPGTVIRLGHPPAHGRSQPRRRADGVPAGELVGEPRNRGRRSPPSQSTWSSCGTKVWAVSSRAKLAPAGTGEEVRSHGHH